jgi:hypothetical protein
MNCVIDVRKLPECTTEREMGKMNARLKKGGSNGRFGVLCALIIGRKRKQNR